jgi:hypothetical protein
MKDEGEGKEKKKKFNAKKDYAHDKPRRRDRTGSEEKKKDAS